MKKRIISLCLIIAILIALMPQISFPANAVQTGNAQGATELRAYTAFPQSLLGAGQESIILFAMFTDGKQVSLESYSFQILDPDCLEAINAVQEKKLQIVTVKGANPGSTELIFTERTTGASITVPITVTDNCQYYRCSDFPGDYVSRGSIYVDSFECTVNQNGSHDISFNAYNRSYSYGVVEVYNEMNHLIRLVSLDPRTDGSGMEFIVNGFKDSVEPFISDSPFYAMERNSKSTDVTLKDIPENAKIVISSDGKETPFIALHTGVDIFVKTVCAVSSIDLKVDTQAKIGQELLSAIADSVTESTTREEKKRVESLTLLNEAADTISAALSFGLSKQSAYSIYETMYKLFDKLKINVDDILQDLLKDLGYSVLDAIFMTIVPVYKFADAIIQIIGLAWPSVDYDFNLGRGKMEVYVNGHGLSKFETENVKNQSIQEYEFDYEHPYFSDWFRYVVGSGKTAEIVEYCGREESVIIPTSINGYSVVSIGERAFSSQRYYLKYVTIPESVISIGDYAFELCYHINEITIPTNVRFIGKNPFRGTMTSVVVSPDHPTLAVIDNVLFEKTEKRLIAYPRLSSKTSYTIPNGIKIIDDSAFAMCQELTRITIPDSVIAIRDYAFSSCENLTQIRISDNVMTIGAYAFADCSSLDQLLIPDSVTLIGDYAFGGCSSLTQLFIPNSVISVGMNPFTGVDIDIQVSQEHTKLEVVDGVLFEKKSSRLVYYPVASQNSVYVVPEGTRTIDGGAFSDNAYLSEIKIPASVTEIGDGAFASCISLTQITMPVGVGVIGEATFHFCKSMKSVIIPDGVVSIGNYAFYCCKNLEEVSIPNSVTIIGESAFHGCETLTHVTLSNGITSIGSEAFYMCENLVQITIPDSVISIGFFAFDGCEKLTAIVGRNSFAAQYCKDNDIPYQYPDSLDWLTN